MWDVWDLSMNDRVLSRQKVKNSARTHAFGDFFFFLYYIVAAFCDSPAGKYDCLRCTEYAIAMFTQPFADQNFCITHTHTRARILWCLHNIITHFIGWMFGNVFCFSRILFAWKCFLDCSWAVPMQTPAYVCYWWGWGVTQRYGVCHRVRKQQKAIIEGAFRYFPSFFFVDSTLFCSSHQFLICMSFHSVNVDACSHIDSRPPTAYNNIWWPHRFYCFILVSH